MTQQRGFRVKLGCSVLTFGFVAVFHGNKSLLSDSKLISIILGVADGAVLIWSLLNWIGIVLEMVGSSIKKHGQYKVLKGDL